MIRDSYEKAQKLKDSVEMLNFGRTKTAEANFMVKGDEVHIGVVYDIFLDLKEHLQSLPEHTLVEKQTICDFFDCIR